MSVLADAPAPRPSIVGSTVLLGLAMLMALTFFAIAAVPYLTDPGYNAVAFASRRWILLTHIGGGTLAIFSGPIQIWLGLADRNIKLHRSLGLVYIAGVLIGSASAYTLALQPTGDWVYALGLSGLATAWLTTTGMAFAAIKKSLIEQHKEWMIRSYVVTLAFVFFRALFSLLQANHIGTEAQEASFCAWASWSVPLLVNEAVMQGRKIVAVRA